MTTPAWLDIEELILLNQATQGVRPVSMFSAWFEALPQDRRRLVLEKFAEMIRHARPLESDGTAAVENSGLKSSLTPCVVLAKGANRTQLTKLCSLPKSEQGIVLVLFVFLFRIADQRRRDKEQGSSERHWWHQNLGDAVVVEEIRRRYREGQL